MMNNGKSPAENQRSSSNRALEVGRRIIRHENAVLGLILLVLALALGIMTKGLSISRGNISNVLLQSSSRGIAAVGQLFVILTSGIDVSIGGAALLSAVFMSVLLTSFPENILGFVAPLYMAIPLMLLLGSAVGLTNGLFISSLGIPALITTLAMWQITTGGAFVVTRGKTIFGLPEHVDYFGQDYIGGIPVAVVMFIVIAVIAYFVLQHTTYGRSIYAVGGGPQSAWLSGLNVRKITLSVYVVSSFLAAISGLILMSRTGIASMNTAKGLELDSIAGAVIGGVSLMGGRGSLIGVVLGVIILGVINNGMNILAIDPVFQGLVKGWIIISAVAIDVRRRRGG